MCGMRSRRHHAGAHFSSSVSYSRVGCLVLAWDVYCPSPISPTCAVFFFASRVFRGCYGSRRLCRRLDCCVSVEHKLCVFLMQTMAHVCDVMLCHFFFLFLGCQAKGSGPGRGGTASAYMLQYVRDEDDQPAAEVARIEEARVWM